MADLLAIGYDDTTTASQAMEAVEQLEKDLVIQLDAAAVIVRRADGKLKVETNHHSVGAGTMWGTFWGLLFGFLFFVPFLGMGIGAGLGALFGKIEKTGIGKEFQEQVRDLLRPGTSALFLVVEEVPPETAVEALSAFGGTVLKTSLSKEAEAELQRELHGTGAAS